MLSRVLERCMRLKFDQRDVYAKHVGGICEVSPDIKLYIAVRTGEKLKEKAEKARIQNILNMAVSFSVKKGF